MKKDDEYYMNYAIKLANRGRFTTDPNPNVGCVIVRDKKIVGVGWHQCAGELHAEISALRMADNLAYGSTVYITLEPCTHYGLTPPCCNELIKAGIARAVIAMKDPNPKVNGFGLHLLKKAGIDVIYGVMFSAAAKINQGFIKRMLTGMPFIQLKLGMSLDGRTAMSNGKSKWITSLESRRDVQNFRAQSSAILSTSSTILSDDPKLTVRWKELNQTNKLYLPKQKLRQPIRIIIDSNNLITPEHKIINQPGKIWLIRCQKDILNWPINVKQIVVPRHKNYISLKESFLMLGKLKINTVLVEAGASLSGAMIQSKMIDEIILYIAPRLLGNNARGLFNINNLNNLSDSPFFSFTEICQLGQDLRIKLIPKY